MAPPNFRVVIVGGGVGGLTLANALGKAGVDYVLLEGRDDFVTETGASIALGPHGYRILDQLGCYDIIERQADPLTRTAAWNNGKFLRASDHNAVNHKRFGYPIAFCTRHLLLKTLYENIEDKSPLLPRKRVSRIDHNHKNVSVQCKDGTTYYGDVVVGADGVHSLVRDEMFRHIEVNEPGLLDAEDKVAMFSEYKCMYGTSKPTEGLSRPEQAEIFNQVLGHGLSFLHSNDKSGRVFWFIFEQMDKRYQMPNIPKYSDEDALALVQRCLDIPMNDEVRFADLWDNRLAFKLVPLEEALFRHWRWGRMVCIGDSVHKWTPNIGQGGNHAVESAALLANILNRLAHENPAPSPKAIEEALKGFQQRREPRAAAASKASNLITRLEAFKGWKEKFLILHVLGNFGDWVANQVAANFIGAEILDFLPHPARSSNGTMRFNQNYGIGTTHSMAWRVVLALPFLALSLFARTIFNNIIAQPALGREVQAALTSSQINFNDQVWTLPTQVEPLSLLVTVFSPSVLGIDSAQRIQSATFLTDLAPLWLIVILEAHRRANAFKYTFTFPIVYGIAFQLFGIGIVGPIWFFLHYVQSPIADYLAKDWRLVNVAAAKTAALAIFPALPVLTLAMYYLPDLTQRLTVNAIWQPFPVWTVVLHFILRKLFVRDTTPRDKIHNTEADMPHTRAAVWLFTVTSAVVFNVARFSSESSFASLFFPDWTLLKATFASSDGSLDIISGMRLFLQVDEIVCFSAAFLWLAYLIRDLKEAEMTSVSWAKAGAAAAAGTYLIGPGAVVMLGWWWRENILATKFPKGSPTRTA